MKKSEKKGDSHEVIFGIVGGLMMGFVLAMTLGVFRVERFELLPSWLQGIAGVFSALISVWAVYLVAGTLKETKKALIATEKTLTLTQEMAAAQAEIGELEIRPFIEYCSSDFTYDSPFINVEVEIKNFGNTPAIGVVAEPVVRYLQRFPDDCDEDEPEAQHFMPESQNVLAPQQTMTIRQIGFERGLIDKWKTIVIINLKYKRRLRKKPYTEILVFKVVQNHEKLHLEQTGLNFDAQDE